MACVTAVYIPQANHAPALDEELRRAWRAMAAADRAALERQESSQQAKYKEKRRAHVADAVDSDGNLTEHHVTLDPAIASFLMRLEHAQFHALQYVSVTGHRTQYAQLLSCRMKYSPATQLASLVCRVGYVPPAPLGEAESLFCAEDML